MTTRGDEGQEGDERTTKSKNRGNWRKLRESGTGEAAAKHPNSIAIIHWLRDDDRVIGKTVSWRQRAAATCEWSTKESFPSDRGSTRAGCDKEDSIDDGAGQRIHGNGALSRAAGVLCMISRGSSSTGVTCARGVARGNRETGVRECRSGGRIGACQFWRMDPSFTKGVNKVVPGFINRDVIGSIVPDTVSPDQCHGSGNEVKGAGIGPVKVCKMDWGNMSGVSVVPY
ncbi:hypothetical protein EDB92DRAFT_1818930 [Lactarius akahatsu]|uniref:Uncharacterized protein n=1 Tax=Lactarius akahatsu TaxID=416441 RepID=A0AAD4Q7K9_9AGAM|nr:hypothetical protein EDB92DRAFT_1818930 [Lactarius akahatsu]